MSVKTIVELDLVGYSDLLTLIEDNLDTRTALKLNEQIQGFVAKALAAVGSGGRASVLKTSGDGAILEFDSPLEANDFAINLHFAAQDHNVSRVPAAHRWFRVGITTGELGRSKGRDKDFGGKVVTRAVRLESAVQAGQILADAATVGDLPSEFRRLYGPRELVHGKREEQFVAHRCTVIPYAIPSSGERELSIEKASVFVGCSRSGEPHARALKAALERQVDVTLWQSGIVSAPPEALENFWTVVRSSDFGVLIFGLDELDLVAKWSAEMRDHFFLAFGLLCGRLGKQRVFLLAPDGADLGILANIVTWTIADYQPKLQDLILGMQRAFWLIRLAVNREGRLPDVHPRTMEPSNTPLETVPSFMKLDLARASKTIINP